MRPRWWLLFGDWVALTVVLVVGFVFHGTLNVASVLRLAWGAVVLALAWALAALPTGAVDPRLGGTPRGWWRWLWATVLAVPLALVLYEAPRGRPVVFPFVVTMIAFSFLGVAAWRGLYWWLYGRRA